MTVPLDKDGNAPLSLLAQIDESRYQSQAGISLDNVRWELRHDGSVVDWGDYSAGDNTVVDLSGASTTPYQLAAWYDGDGNGERDNGEQELVVTVESVQLDTLTVFSTNHVDNKVEKPIIGPGEILYVELEDGESSVPISLAATHFQVTGPIPGTVTTLWSVTGPGVNQMSQELNGVTPPVDLTSAGGTYTTKVGFDLNGDGSLGEDEVAIESETVVVQVAALEVTEKAYTSNKATTSADDPIEPIYVAAQSDGSATVKADALGLPLTSEAGKRVLWKAFGAGFGADQSGDFGGADPEFVVNLTADDVTNVIGIGFDDNADGVLSNDEATRHVFVQPFTFEIDIADDKITYTPSSSLSDASDYDGRSSTEFTIKTGQSNVPFAKVKDRVATPTIESLVKNADGGPSIPAEGEGEITAIDADAGQWSYAGPIEATLNKHPDQLVATIGVKALGSDAATVTDTTRIFSIFNHYKLFSPDKPLLLQYVNSKYGLVNQVLFDQVFSYNASLPNDGFTRPGLTGGGRTIEIGEPPFQSENLVASTIGHEFVHYNQPVHVFLGPESGKEPEAYQWELDNAVHTGITASDIAAIHAAIAAI